MFDNVLSSDLQDSCANSFANRSMTSGDGTVASWELKLQRQRQNQTAYKQKQRHHNCTQTQVVDPNWLPTNIKISKRFLADNMLRRSKNTTAQPSIAKPHIRQLISPHPATAPFAQRATTTNHVLAWQHCLMAHKTPGTHVAYTFSDYGSCSKNKNDQPLAVNKSPLRNTRISIPTCQKQGCRFKTVQP